MKSNPDALVRIQTDHHSLLSLPRKILLQIFGTYLCKRELASAIELLYDKKTVSRFILSLSGAPVRSGLFHLRATLK